MPVNVYPVDDDEVRVVIEESNVGVGAEFTITIPWRKARLLRAKSIVLSGSATTHTAVLTRVPGSVGTIYEEFRACPIEDTPSIVDQQPNDPVLVYGIAPGVPCPPGNIGTLYYRPGVDAGANNMIQAEFFFRAGWPE